MLEKKTCSAPNLLCVASLSSLDHFYLALGVTKENEDITHTIPFHSKGASGVQTI